MHVPLSHTNKHWNVCIFSTVTPNDYEPPGFKAAQSDIFQFEEEPMNIKVGDVVTVSKSYRSFSTFLYSYTHKF